jgi:hypothetical protein
MLRRASGHLIVLLACSLLFASAVAATVLPPSTDPLPGSSFQGADGNQNDAAPRIDWQAMEAMGRAYHSPDPNASDTAFEDGSKEDEPGDWDLTTEAGGVNPGKDNILDGWSALDQGGAEAFLYLGFARENAEGSAFLAFELNHDTRLWHNGTATIPCRRTGDVLVSYEPEGNDVDVVIQRWVTLATDPDTGCATRGRLDEHAAFRPNIDAQGAINSSAIAARLPGFYDGTVPAGRFGEAALNLSRIFEGGFDDACFSFGSVWLHSRSSTSESSNLQDYVAPEGLAVRTCAASGTKFHDLNGNGSRDSGEPGLARWVIWADYDDDGVRDAAEPFAYTDNEGQYVINDIRPPDGTYRLREALPTAAARRRAAGANVTCSHPSSTAPGGQFPCAWGPISTATTSYARARDFGNYLPAELVVRKELAPPSDLGRFDLFVNGAIEVAAAGDGASRTVSVRPGLHNVSEAAATGTDAADYRSTVECKRGTRRGQLRSGPVYADLVLSSDERAVCTFRNIRPGAPAIAIDKTGPATAQAGDTLSYTLYVSNPGDVPFPAASVRVTDAACDDPPQLVGKAPDASPGTLDPGDTWTYRCSRKTAAAGPGCTPSVVPNSATAAGTAGGATVSDTSSIETALSCPPPSPTPGPQPPTPPSPQPPSPVVPPGPRPPDAGDAARAALLLARATRGCIGSRAPRVSLQGTRIASARVFVNGELRRRFTVETLQRRVTPRVRLAPGRYRLTVGVTFERGTGSPPVTLSRVIRICSAEKPARFARAPFTG